MMSRCNSRHFEKVSVVICNMATDTFLPRVLTSVTPSMNRSVSSLLDSGFDYVTCFDHCNISNLDTSWDLKNTDILRYTNSHYTGSMRPQ